MDAERVAVVLPVFQRPEGLIAYPEGACTQELGTWVLGHSTYGTGLGQVYDYWVLGPFGLGAFVKV